MSSDQQRLIIDETDNPPSYQDATNQGKSKNSSIHSIEQFLGGNSYGAIIVQPVTTSPPYNPYAFGSQQQQQQPTVIVVGGCPTCKVRIKFLYYFIY